MANLSHVRVALQIHADNPHITRNDDNCVTYQPPPTKTRTPDPRKIHFDGCFDARATSTEIYTQCGVGAFIDRALQGYTAGVFAIGSGKLSAQKRTGIFEPLVKKLKSAAKLNGDITVEMVHLGITDTKCIDLVNDRPADISDGLRTHFRNVGTWAPVEEVIRKGCSLPWIMDLKFETKKQHRTVGHLVLADLGMVCFDEEVNENVFRQRGPGVTKSVWIMKKIVRMLTQNGAEGTIPFADSTLTSICRDFLGGKAATKFIIHVDGRDSVSANEIAGVVDFAETMRKIKTLECVNDVDPRVAELQTAIKELEAQVRDLRALTEKEALKFEFRMREQIEGHNAALAELEQQKEKEGEERQKDFDTRCLRMKDEFAATLLECNNSWKQTVVKARNEKDDAIQLLKEELEEAQLTARVEVTKALHDKAAVDEALRKERVQMLLMSHDYQQLRLDNDELLRNSEKMKTSYIDLEKAHQELVTVKESLENRCIELQADLDTERANARKTMEELEITRTALNTSNESLERVKYQLEIAETESRDKSVKIDEIEKLLSEKQLELVEQSTQVDRLEKKLVGSEARLDEARLASDRLKEERDAATARLEVMRDQANSEVASIREQVDKSRDETAETRDDLLQAKETIKNLRAEKTKIEAASRDEVAKMQKEVENLRKNSEKVARELERAEGRFEGEREGWIRERESWERERRRLVDEVQELKMEAMRARISGSEEGDKVKAWFEKLELENRRLRDEIDHVKASRREDRTAEAESERVRMHLARLESENQRMAEDVARKERELAHEKARLETLAKTTEKAVPAKRNRKKQPVEVVEEDVDDYGAEQETAEQEEITVQRKKKARGRKKKDAPKIENDAPLLNGAHSDLDDDHQEDEVREVASQGKERTSHGRKNARSPSPFVEEIAEIAEVSQNAVVASVKPKAKGRAKKGATVAASKVADVPAGRNEPSDLLNVGDEPSNVESASRPTARKRKNAPKKSDPEVPSHDASPVHAEPNFEFATVGKESGNQTNHREPETVVETRSDVTATEPMVEVAVSSGSTKKRKKMAPIETPSTPPQQSGQVSVDDILGITTGVGETIESEKENRASKKGKGKGKGATKELLGETLSEKEKDTKKRKLNPKRKISLEVVEEDQVENKEKKKSQFAPAVQPAATGPPVLSLSQRAAALSTLTTGENRLGYLKARIPNLNASGRMEFKKRPGLDPERMKTILQGYGISD
ncbi:uncharacterized protein SPPG_02801 [Spizellomyces punctatus DAOM BR117]|uniref:Kinesin motor domain-containing protein n=1 Tax=Spizellomyces punctatus (strain DAOM BR117) TaxID=645134 RepID=A0A0L0HMM6_SPIPD|nr:uncharacterized protein SPPG_02801 [Spizellomyces punctatus DAOM BR117]KND02328.1 hypothetical protein SPPG_02801 [Spizellomyces punctatus DAOM BR117]|eukprot:XP_016610367.1 hypothetical protein SPPG_02801 [Spizellomyces punctatus DAOM BR117]